MNVENEELETVLPASSTPDGPTELPDDPGLPPDPNLNAPLESRKQPADDKPKPKPQPAYKFDPRIDIYKRRSEQLAEEQAESDEVFDDGRQTDALPREEPAEPATPLASADEFVTIKVYGVERQAPKAEVEQAGGVAAYQKAVAAEVKLEEAARREAAVRAEEARLLRIANNLKNGLDENGQPLAAPKPPVTGVPASAISKEALGPTVKALYSGDADEAAEALAQVLSQVAPNTQPATPEIVRAVTAQVQENLRSEGEAREAERDLKEANRIFRETFKEIASDPDMMVWAKGMANTLSADPENQGKSRAEIATLVGTRIREKLGRPTTTAMDERRALKRNLPQTPTGSGRVPAPEPKRFQTNAEYIEQLRRNSGSNSAPR